MRLDLVGKRFGWLKVQEEMEPNEHGHSMFLCECGCGKKKIIRGHNLKNGSVTSCGCKRKRVNDFLWKNKNEDHILLLPDFDRHTYIY